MKKLLTVIVLVLFVTGLNAQQAKSTTTQTATKSTMHHNMKDCVMMKDGKMMMMKDGKTMPMNADTKMENGSMVNMQGVVIMPDGNKKMMKNGDCIDMKGMWMKSDNKAKSANPTDNKKQAETKSE